MKTKLSPLLLGILAVMAAILPAGSKPNEHLASLSNGVQFLDWNINPLQNEMDTSNCASQGSRLQKEWLINIDVKPHQVSIDGEATTHCFETAPLIRVDMKPH